MAYALHLWMVFTLGGFVIGAEGFRCYECYHVYSERGGLTTGDPRCSDPSWDLSENDTGVILTDECIACTKTLTNLGDDRYEVFRNCVIYRRGYDPAREQKNNTCATTTLKAGNYYRCTCTQDLCNAELDCEVANPCIDPPGGNCPACPGDTCPTPPSSATAPSTPGLGLIVVMLLLGY